MRWALGLLPLASGLCLPNGIPAADRKLLVNANGESYPLGVWAANYAATHMAAKGLKLYVLPRSHRRPVLDESYGM